MAFNMKRPIIKGTVLHKASIAKQKEESIVTPAAAGADQALVAAGDALGRSNVGQAVDFSIDSPELEFKSKKRKPKKKKEKREQDYGTYKDYLAEDDKLRYQMYADELSSEGVDDRNIQSKEEWDKSNNKDQNPSLSEQEWVDRNVEQAGMKRYKVRKEKVKKEKRDDKPGTVVSRAIDKLKEALKNAKTNREKKKLEKEISKQEKNTAAEEAVEEPKAEETTKSDAERAQAEKDKVAQEEFGQMIDRSAAERKARQMSKKEVIEVGEVKPVAIGGKQVQQYNIEQKERLKTEGVFSEDAGKVVLPEEIVDGTYVPKGEGTIVQPIEISNEKKNELANIKEGPEEDTEDPSNIDNNNNDIPDFLEANNPIQQRDDRIWGYAKKGGLIHQNMRKKGYIPQDEK